MTSILSEESDPFGKRTGPKSIVVKSAIAVFIVVTQLPTTINDIFNNNYIFICNNNIVFNSSALKKIFDLKIDKISCRRKNFQSYSFRKKKKILIYQNKNTLRPHPKWKVDII